MPIDTNSDFTLQDPKHIFEKYPIDFLNASAVFNMVEGAGKQKSANLFPVGVSFIPAYLPANTLMYHATYSTEVPDHFEWVAMDYEFSYNFASFPRGIKPGRSHGSSLKHGQSILGQPVKDEKFKFRLNRNFLYTFRNTKPLDKLLFLDGASAAKTSTGEMDQQAIISKLTNSPNDNIDEYDAAKLICDWGKPFGLQGFVRMEIGFEIVLCSFHDNIELVSNVTLSNVTELGNVPWENPVPLTKLEKKRSVLIDGWHAMGGLEWLGSGDIVNDGEPRILLDFSKTVTPLNETWISPDPYSRRLVTLPEDYKQDLVQRVAASLTKPVDPFGKNNWQIVVDKITDKFTPILLSLNNTLTVFRNEAQTVNLSTAIEHAVFEISRITYNSVRRYVHENDAEELKASLAIERAIIDYVHHSFPLRSQSDILIYSSIYKVSTEILTAIFDIFYLARQILPDVYVVPDDQRYQQYHAMLTQKSDDLSELLQSLRWAVFTQCSEKCSFDQVCYVPTKGPNPLGWNRDDISRYFDFYDDRFRVPQDLQCLGYKDMKIFGS